MPYSLKIDDVEHLPQFGVMPISGGQPFGASINRLVRRYDSPAKLNMFFPRDWRLAPARADAKVALRLNGELKFFGVLDVPRVRLSGRDFPGVEATAYDYSYRLSFPTAQTADGDTSIPIYPGTLKNAIDQYLVHVGAEMAARGVLPEVIYLNGASEVYCLPVSIENQSIDAGMRAIVANAPGVRVLMYSRSSTLVSPTSHVENLYVCINIAAALPLELKTGVHSIGEVDIIPSVEGRAGAVRTRAFTTPGSAEVVALDVFEAQPAWAATPLDRQIMQDRWTWDDAFTKDETGAPTELANVYRLYSFNDPDGLVGPHSQVAGRVKVEKDEVNPRYQFVKIEKVDYEAKTFLLARPAVGGLSRTIHGRLNVHEPGRAIPADVALWFTNDATASAPIAVGERRWPEEGYAGQVMDVAPETCAVEKLIDIPGGVDASTYVQQAWRVYSQLAVSGTIEATDDRLRDELWWLARLINISAPDHGLTGWENLAAPLEGITLDFKARKLTIEFLRDETVDLPGGT